MKKPILLILLLFITFTPSTSADWAYGFVVNSGNIYVVDKTEIDAQQIDKKIGDVTFYSDREGTYSGNFSNVYPAGTEYYSVKGVSPDKEIAVKTEDGLYIKAVYNGHYAGATEPVQPSAPNEVKDNARFWLGLVAGTGLLTFVFFSYIHILKRTDH